MLNLFHGQLDRLSPKLFNDICVSQEFDALFGQNAFEKCPSMVR